MADRTSLARATDSSDSPTPGYLYLDIAKSVAASPIACTETVAYLKRRLETQKNHNVKHKCCKVMGMVAASPVTRGVFKREIVKDTGMVSAIKECLTFSGKADPIRGDAIYQKVRDAAKECLDIVYSDDSSTVEYKGSDTYSSTRNPNNPYSIGTGKRMEGIGNPMFADPRSVPETKGISQMTISEAFQTAKEGFRGIVNDPFAKNVPTNAPPSRYGGVGNTTSQYGSSSYDPSSYGRDSNSVPPPGQRELTNATNGQWTMASNRGPNAYRPNMAPVSNTSVGGSWATSNTNSVASTARDYSMPVGAPVVSGRGGSAVKDGSYEKQLVAELCPPGGMKAEPPRDKLRSFQEAIPSLDADFVCPALLDCLEDGQPWIIRAKALCVMEATLSTQTYSDFFHACASEIQPLAQHPRAAVRDPAKRILTTLGINPTPTTESTKPTPQANPPVAAPPVAPAADLLDFGASPPPLPASAPPPVPLPPVPPPSGPFTNDMFGGMNLKSNTPVTAPTTTDKQGTLLPTAAAPNSMATATENSIECDIFGDMNVKESSPSMFGDVTVKETKPTEAAPSGSAFSFIQSDKPASQTESESTPETSAPSPAPPKQSFDPLLSGSNNNNMAQMNNMNNMMFPPQQQMAAMGINPQMQAAFFQQQQQMMMMQQMQMQQSMQQAKLPVMGGSPAAGGGGVSTSFAFMDDPAKVEKEQQNKSFDFVKDAMNGAK